MGDYLARNTALLPAIEPHEPKHAIGTSTVEAMHSGAVYGYRGMVKEILAKLEEEMGKRPTVVATGGDAALIAGSAAHRPCGPGYYAERPADGCRA